MTTLLRFNKITLIVLFFLIFISVSSHAQNTLVPETMEPFKIDIILGKSIVMKSEINVKRISIGSPEIADFILLSPKEIYIQGKAAGLTNMILWQDNKVTSIYDIEVKYDLSRLKEKLYQILPDEKEIRIMSTNDSLTLLGRISSAENLSQAMALAESYAPSGKIINLLTVGGTHQVMLEVKIAEMSRSVGRNLGIDLENISHIGDVAIQLFSNFGVDATIAGGPILGLGYNTWDATLNALKSTGRARVVCVLASISSSSLSFSIISLIFFTLSFEPTIRVSISSERSKMPSILSIPAFCKAPKSDLLRQPVRCR